MSVDPPIRGNGGVQGFGFEFPASVKTSLNADGGLRVTPDPSIPDITMLEIRLPGVPPRKIVVGGEWEILFLP